MKFLKKTPSIDHGDTSDPMSKDKMVAEVMPIHSPQLNIRDTSELSYMESYDGQSDEELPVDSLLSSSKHLSPLKLSGGYLMDAADLLPLSQRSGYMDINPVEIVNSQERLDALTNRKTSDNISFVEENMKFDTPVMQHGGGSNLNNVIRSEPLVSDDERYSVKSDNEINAINGVEKEIFNEVVAAPTTKTVEVPTEACLPSKTADTSAVDKVESRADVIVVETNIVVDYHRQDPDGPPSDSDSEDRVHDTEAMVEAPDLPVEIERPRGTAGLTNPVIKLPDANSLIPKEYPQTPCINEPIDDPTNQQVDDVVPEPVEFSELHAPVNNGSLSIVEDLPKNKLVSDEKKTEASMYPVSDGESSKSDEVDHDVTAILSKPAIVERHVEHEVQMVSPRKEVTNEIRHNDVIEELHDSEVVPKSTVEMNTGANVESSGRNDDELSELKQKYDAELKFVNEQHVDDIEDLKATHFNMIKELEHENEQVISRLKYDHNAQISEFTAKINFEKQRADKNQRLSVNNDQSDEIQQLHDDLKAARDENVQLKSDLIRNEDQLNRLEQDHGHEIRDLKLAHETQFSKLNLQWKQKLSDAVEEHKVAFQKVMDDLTVLKQSVVDEEKSEISTRDACVGVDFNTNTEIQAPVTAFNQVNGVEVSPSVDIEGGLPAQIQVLTSLVQLLKDQLVDKRNELDTSEVPVASKSGHKKNVVLSESENLSLAIDDISEDISDGILHKYVPPVSDIVRQRSHNLDDVLSRAQRFLIKEKHKVEQRRSNRNLTSLNVTLPYTAPELNFNSMTSFNSSWNRPRSSYGALNDFDAGSPTSAYFSMGSSLESDFELNRRLSDLKLWVKQFEEKQTAHSFFDKFEQTPNF